MTRDELMPSPTATTRAGAHLGWSKSEKPFLRNGPVLSTDRDSVCLDLLTDAQALATWERMKAVRKAYVAAIIEKVPA